MGGGGFTMEPDNPLLDDYILKLARRRRPRVCFIPTASGDAADYIAGFEKAFKQRAITAVLRLFDREAGPPPAMLLDQDIIYVGGGNTANMLAIWRLHGVDKVLRAAWRRGVILAGISAGMSCWFEASVTLSFGSLADQYDGLGLLRGSACPHYDDERNRRAIYHRLIRAGLPGGIAADDGAALHAIGRRIVCCVSSRPAARVYRVRVRGTRIVETPLETQYLGSRRPPA